MSKIFCISDTHFNHVNVIKYSNRPYSSVEEMNKSLIRNWNNVVGPDDTVIFQGDFSLGSKEDAIGFISQLNGHKVIILGNHDRSRNFYLQNGFQDAIKRFVYPKGASGFKYDIIFTHQPYIGLEPECVNIHGHIHEKTLGEGFEPSRYFNVSVENINYTPIELNEIINKMGW